MSTSPELEELIDLLKSDDVRIIKHACEYFCGLSGSQDGLSVILHNDPLFCALLKFCGHEVPEVKQNALKTVTNCLQIPSAVQLFITVDKNHEFTERFMTNFDTESETNVNHVCSILENITREKFGALHIFRFIKKNGLLNKLITLFTSNKSSYHHLSHLFGNLCQLSEVRKLFTTNNGLIFDKILPFIGHESSICRQGIANMIKNCCFETDFHEWILRDDTVVSSILLPLAGPEELTEEENETLPIDLQYLGSDKVRESSNDIRMPLVQSLHKLCATQNGRNSLRQFNVYLILRELDKATIEIEGNEQLTQEIHNVIQILIGDDDPECDDLQALTVPSEVESKLKEMGNAGKT